MKSTIKLLILLTYTISVFFIDQYWILGIIAICNILLMILLKVPKIKALKNIYFLSFFILFTAIINLFLADVNTAILIAIRLILVCNFTYTFTYIFSPMQLAKAIEVICTPLKIIGVEPKDISLIISIAITFIPILSNEFMQVNYALRAKGLKMTGINKIKSIKFIMKPLLYGMFKRTNEIEYALKAKGYVE